MYPPAIFNPYVNEREVEIWACIMQVATQAQLGLSGDMLVAWLGRRQELQLEHERRRWKCEPGELVLLGLSFAHAC